MSQVNLHESASTQFQEVGDVRLAYRRFGKEGAPPLVCLQHFTGTMNNWDPVHANRLAQDRPVVLVDYRGVGRSTGQTPDSMQDIARDIIAFIQALGAEQVDLFADLAMSGRDGRWLVDQVEKSARPVPVIALTGYEPDYDLTKAPFARVLTKPVQPEALAAEILRVLGRQST
jgi:CheY-like chemotaxis protein